MVTYEVPTQTNETKKPDINIPKSREIFSGDINDAVIAVQQITGFEITPEWWMNEVGNDGPTEDILDRFDLAFEKFVYEEMGIELPEDTVSAKKAEVIGEAEQELQNFDAEFGDDPGSVPLRGEFLDALSDHLRQKYFSDEARIDTVENSESEDRGEVIRDLDSVTVVTENSGKDPNHRRFSRVEKAPVVAALGASYETRQGDNGHEGSSFHINVLPSARKINSVSKELFPDDETRLTFLEVGDDVANIDAKTYLEYLSRGEVPLAGIKDLNYLLHDRAIDDHVVGWLLMPPELNSYIEDAARVLTGKAETGEAGLESAKRTTAAYDYLTATVTNFAWYQVNKDIGQPLTRNMEQMIISAGESSETTLYLLGKTKEALEDYPKLAEERYHFFAYYGPLFIKAMIETIAIESGVDIPFDQGEIMQHIQDRAEIMGDWVRTQ